MSRSSATQLPSDPKPNKVDWGEGELAEKSREKRLRDRLKRWEKGEAALLEEIPKLSTLQENEDGDERPEIIVISPNGLPGFPSLGGGGGGGMAASTNGQPQNGSSFFRTCVLLPKLRSLPDERAARVARRREINELTMRMGVGAAGGIVEQDSATPGHLDSLDGQDQDHNEATDTPPEKHPSLMWEDWGNRIEVWSNVRQIADRAIGNTLASTSASSNLEKATLDSTVVPWFAVQKAWTAQRSSKHLRLSWLKEAFSVNKTIREEDEADESKESGQDLVDEVIERVKNESELDSHEQRLLSCIVDAGKPSFPCRLFMLLTFYT